MSPGEQEAVRLISQAGLEAEICSATRSVVRDIDVAIDAGVDSVNIIIPTSRLHIMKKLTKTPEEMLEVTTRVVEHAKDRGVMAEICLEDGSRTETPYLKEVIRRVIADDGLVGLDVHACYSADEHASLGDPFEAEPCLDVVQELEGDRDLFDGCVAGSFAEAVHRGVDVGGSAGDGCDACGGGQAEVVMGVDAEEESGELPVDLAVPLGALLRGQGAHGVAWCDAVYTGVDGAFAHESGIHTHAILRDPSTYERIDPKLVGAARRIVSGKHAGSTGLSMSLEEMGLHPSKDQFDLIYQQVKELGDQGNTLSDTDVYAIAAKTMNLEQQRNYELDEFIVTTGNKITPTASVKMRRNGEYMIEAATGNGPVDATLNALIKAVKPDQAVNLEVYHVEAITGGTDAVVNVEVRLRQGDKVVTSRGVDEDIVMASVDAYLKGVNLYHSMRKQR